MKRRLAIVLATSIALLVLVPSVASAAPSFGFAELKREQATVYGNDERVDYTIKLKNTGDAPTSGSTALAISGLPSGVEFGFGSGGEWTCHASASVCTSSAVKAPGADFASLSISLFLYPDEVPSAVTVNFTAFGGGASSDAFAQDAFTFAPAKPFEIVSLAAAACSQPPAVANPSFCSTSLNSAEFTEAGEHPYAAASAFRLSTRLQPGGAGAPGLAPGEGSVESLRDLYFELPAGFIGNLEALPGLCTFSEVEAEICPESAAVGGIDADTSNGDFTGDVPIYRIVPEDGYVAAFAFKPSVFSTSGFSFVLRVKLRANGDYGVTAASPLPPQAPRLYAIKRAVLCSYGANAPAINEFDGCKKSSDVGANPIPFLTNPTRCAGAAPETNVVVDSYDNPATLNDEGFPDLSDPDWKSKSVTSPSGTGCLALTEAWTGSAEPSFSFQPDTTRAAAPAAYTANLHIPQDGLSEPEGTATSHLKDTTVTLPEGIALNPSAANGLGVCTLADVGYLGNNFPSPNRIHFKTTAPGCPGNSKVGIAEVSTPVLADPLPGAIYLAAQDENPFGSKFAVYLVIDDPKTGVEATVPGRVTPDQNTGRIATVFKDNPQAPIEDVEIEFFEGPRASLANPDLCADYTTTTQMTPWSAVDPDAPTAAEIATPESKVTIATPPAGQSACATTKAGRPFAPTLDAGSTQLQAGSHTPFSLRITRGEGEQELSGVKVVTPPGFAATLKGVGICSEAAVAAAKAAGRTGKAEIANPSCPASSQVGTTTVGAGAGPNPFYVKSGKIYLTGPYNGAPLSLTFVVPAVAGPFDLGVQVVRAALNVNPVTAQVTAVSDPLPQILEGVPLQVRDVRVDLDRPNFAINPTNCEPMSISAEITGGSGAVANLANRFQVGGCESLGFNPKLKLQVHGGTKRSDYQRLEATVTARPGDANIARAAVTLPHAFFLAQEHIRTVCTRVQFAADACPKGSIYGRAEAISPLIDGELSGPVYLRSSNNLLPDLVVALRGPDAQPIEVELAGRTDSKNEGIRNTFDVVPDAPVSKFTLKMFGGQKSLIVNSRDLCKGPKQKAVARFTGQNGKRRDFSPVVQVDCGKRGGKGNGKGEKQGKGSGSGERVAVAGLVARGLF